MQAITFPLDVQIASTIYTLYSFANIGVWFAPIILSKLR